MLQNPSHFSLNPPISSEILGEIHKPKGLDGHLCRFGTVAVEPLPPFHFPFCWFVFLAEALSWVSEVGSLLVHFPALFASLPYSWALPMPERVRHPRQGLPVGFFSFGFRVNCIVCLPLPSPVLRSSLPFPLPYTLVSPPPLLFCGRVSPSPSPTWYRSFPNPIRELPTPSSS